MKNQKRMWALLINLGAWEKGYQELPFDEELWDYIVEEAPKAGINTFVIDIGGGIDLASHPELTLKGAWTRKRLRREMQRCREKGITLIPKLNFATPHNVWMGEYRRMLCTPTYYRVCNDLIKEVYELFEHPEYIHLGMDEEDHKHVAGHELAIYRQGELFWHDIRFLIDCVRDTGATPWMWSCPLFDHPEEYKKHIDADEAVLSPWYYNAFRKEHWTPISSRKVYQTYYNEGMYKDMHLQFVEEDPFLVNVRKVAVPLLKEGYRYIPCASVVNDCDWNTADLVEYFKENTPAEQLPGFITSPWRPVLMEHKKHFENTFRFLKEAKEQFYGQE